MQKHAAHNIIEIESAIARLGGRSYRRWATDGVSSGVAADGGAHERASSGGGEGGALHGFRGAERFPGGDYPNQSPTPQGLDVWTRGRRSLLGQDLVLWHIFGVTHIPRLEDWPVMPAETTGFKLVPAGFFDASPAMAVPTTRAIRSAVISSKL